MGRNGRHAAGRHAASATPTAPQVLLPPAPPAPQAPFAPPAPIPDSIEYVAYTPGWEPAPPPLPVPALPAPPTGAPPRPPSIREMLAINGGAAPQADAGAWVPGVHYLPGSGQPPTYRVRRSRSRVGLIVAIAVAALLAAGTGLHVFVLRNPAVDEGSATRSLSFPQQIDGSPATDDTQAAQLTVQVTGQLSTQWGVVPTGSVQTEVYQQPGAATRIVAIGLSVTEIPRLHDVIADHGLAPAMDAFDDGIAAAQPQAGFSTLRLDAVDAGRLGGLMRCGVSTREAVTVDECVWADRSYLVLTIVANPSAGSDSQVATDLRAAAEH